MNKKSKILLGCTLLAGLSLPTLANAQSAVETNVNFLSVSKSDGSSIDVSDRGSVTTNDQTPRVCVETDFPDESATVRITQGGTTVSQAVVSTGSTGDFCFSPDGNLSFGQYSFSASVTNSNEETFSDSIDITIAGSLPETGTPLNYGLVLLTAGAAVTAAGFVMKRRKNKSDL